MSESEFKTDQFTAQTLAEALPYIRRYSGKTIVVKFGGHAMVDEKISQSFARDVVLLRHLGIRPVVVHGGGPQIGGMLERLGIESQFREGLRVTDKETITVVEMVLAGAINKTIVRAINAEGGNAVGLSGSDANLIRARKSKSVAKTSESASDSIVDLGYVGEPDSIDPSILQALANKDADFIPVVAPVGVGPDNDSYNINADTVAGSLAVALSAERLMLLTDVEGVLDSLGKLVKSISKNEIEEMISKGTASGGMVPKLRTAAYAVNNGVAAAVILDGRAKHSLVMELFTEAGAGTLVS